MCLTRLNWHKGAFTNDVSSEGRGVGQFLTIGRELREFGIAKGDEVKISKKLSDFICETPPTQKFF